jgi:hypothetical protein
MPKRKNPVREYLSSIGRKGGEKQVPKGLAKMSSERRREISAQGVAARKKAKKIAKKSAKTAAITK